MINVLCLMSFLFICLTSTYLQATCNNLPDDSIFVGLNQEQWQLYHMSDNRLRLVETNTEPRYPAISSSGRFLAYIDQSGQVIQLDLKNKKSTILLNTNQNAYIQPEYSQDEKSLYLVELVNGISQNTNIVKYHLKDKKITRFIDQPGSQFQPRLINDWLYYINVACVNDCGRIIEELWRRHVISRSAEQVTHLNHMSRSPVIYDDKLTFLSNRTGLYQIFTQTTKPLATHYDQLLDDEASYDFLNVNNDYLYAIRRQKNQEALVCIHNNKVSLIELPASIQRMRNLDIAL